jgi:integrase
MANRVHALLVQMFNFGAAKDIVPASPMAGTERPGGEEKPRKRRLTEEEVKTVWTKLDTAAMSPATRLALKLLLVTAQRRGELTLAEWAHVDTEAALWTIPIELQKTEGSTAEATQPHQVPLSSPALELLAQLRALAGNSRWLLPSQYKKKKADAPYSDRALSQAVRDNQKHFGIPHWTPHDLRRTAASFMTKLGVPRLHVEKVLGHSTGDIAEVYDRHDYLPEKHAALDKWATHLEAVVNGKAQTVVPIALARGE